MLKTLSTEDQKKTRHLNSILSQLRERTKSIHQETEALPLMKRLAQGRATATDYVSFLSTLLLVYSDLERNLSSNGKLIEVLPDLDERRKVPALTSDLYELALRGFRSEASLTERDVTRFAEASSCLPSALGILYVVEGSSLGGLVLLKALTNLLRTFDNRANSFLRGYGPQTQNKWKYFCGILNAIPFGRNEERVLVDRALEMFELIKFELKEYS